MIIGRRKWKLKYRSECVRALSETNGFFHRHTLVVSDIVSRECRQLTLYFHFFHIHKT